MPHNDPTRVTVAAGIEPDANLLKHIESLGLKTINEYVEWCAQHGFSRRTKKHWKERLKERAFVTRAIADARLAQTKAEVRKPVTIIERIFSNELREEDVTQPYLKVICRAFASSNDYLQTRPAFHQLLLHFGKDADLRDMKFVVPQYGRQDANTFIWGLLSLARHAPDWIRPLEGWRPENRNTRRQFSSIARHLLARWPVPVFMDSTWFKGNSDKAMRSQRWFLHIGRGENIRTADLPLLFTKRMAHFFMQAPPDFTVEGALRWGQIHGLGGDARLVKAILGTRLGTHFEHEGFWIEFIHFLVANPSLNRALIGPIIDFIHNQRFVPQEVAIAPGVMGRREPPQPNFSVKGRTPASLQRLVGKWHQSLREVKQPHAQWAKSGIDGFEFIEESGGNVKTWMITELLDSHALAAEGREMQHCVASSISSCLHGKSSIWTMEVEMRGERRKVLTVEVNSATRMICQALGKRNALATEKGREMLRRWAAQAGLYLAKHV